MTLKKTVLTASLLLLLALTGCEVPVKDTSKLNSPATAAAAVKAIRTKAEAGDSEAQNELGDAYRDGLGVPQDWGLDYYWNSLAANAAGTDADTAEIARNVAALHLTAVQIAALDQQVKDFKPTPPPAVPAATAQPPQTAPLQRR